MPGSRIRDLGLVGVVSKDLPQAGFSSESDASQYLRTDKMEVGLLATVTVSDSGHPYGSLRSDLQGLMFACF